MRVTELVRRSARPSIGLYLGLCSGAIFVLSAVFLPSCAEQRASEDVSVGVAETAMSGRFALLQTPPEGIPLEARRVMRRPMYGSKWQLAQRLPSSAQGEFWLVPGKRFLCLLGLRSGEGRYGLSQTCAPIKHVLRHGIANVAIRPQDGRRHRYYRFMVGIVPIQVKRVIAHTRGSSGQIPVDRMGIFQTQDNVSDPPDFLTLK